MSEARVVIDLKEGVIELEGPVDFVRHYLEIYQPAVKRVSQAGNANQETPKRLSGRRRKAKRITCTAAIQKEIKTGFFNEPHYFRDIKKHLNESGYEFKDNNIRNNLKRLTVTGALSTNGKGRGLTYSKPGS